MSTRRVSHYAGFLDSEDDLIEKLLSEWKPRSFDLSEKQHEDDLYRWLRQKLPDVPIVVQYGIAKGKADIVIQDWYVIELKLGFDADVGEFDRCLGQLERYRQKWVAKDRGPVYLLTVGESNCELRDVLHASFKKLNEGYLLGDRFFLLEKREASGSVRAI
jgi:hypothetical protein